MSSLSSALLADRERLRDTHAFNTGGALHTSMPHATWDGALHTGSHERTSATLTTSPSSSSDSSSGGGSNYNSLSQRARHGRSTNVRHTAEKSLDALPSSLSSVVPSDSSAASSSSQAAALAVPPSPISLWFGCEETWHARAVLATYASTLSVCTHRVLHSRAPLEFIGRVKRQQIDVAKLHRLIEQHREKESKAQRRHGRQVRGAMSSLGRSPHQSFGVSPASSPPSSLPAALGGTPLSSSPLRDLPPLGSFATLDIVSIYSRDTLPLGLVFPVIRHEWIATVWNTNDGVPESVTRIRTQYEHEEEEDEDDAEEDEEDAAAKVALALYARCLVKSHRTPVSQQTAAVSPASAAHTASPSDDHPLTLATSAASTSSLTSVSSTSPPVVSSPPPAAVSPSSSSSSVSYLYNLPVFSEDRDGTFNTFGCMQVRPLGHATGRQDQQTQTEDVASSADGSRTRGAGHLHSAADSAAAPRLPALPSSLGYSGAQNDCIYDYLQSLGRKVKCNDTSPDDSAQEARASDGGTTPAVAAGQPTTGETRSVRASSDAGTDMADFPLRHAIDDDDTDDAHAATGFEFGDRTPSKPDRDDEDDDDNEDDDAGEVEEEEDDDDDDDDDESEDDSDSSTSDESDADDANVRKISASKAIAIQRPQLTQSRHRDDQDDDDDDDDSGFVSSRASSYAHSFASPGTSCAAGSLGEELQAQLSYFGFGAKAS